MSGHSSSEEIPPACMTSTAGCWIRRWVTIAYQFSRTSASAPSERAPYCARMSACIPAGAGNRPSPARPKVFNRALSENSPTISGFRLCRANHGVDGAAQRIAAHRKQHRRAVQLPRKVRGMALAQAVDTVKVDADRAEQPGLELEVGVSRRRAIGENQVEPVQCEFGKQVFEIAFDAFQAHRQWRLQHRLEQAEGDQLGYRFAEAHGKAPASRRVVSHGVAQPLAEQKYLVGIVQRGAPGLGQHQRAALGCEQRLPQLLLEHAELGAGWSAPRGSSRSAARVMLPSLATAQK